MNSKMSEKTTYDHSKDRSSPWIRVECPRDLTSMTFIAKQDATKEEMKSWLMRKYPEACYGWNGFGRIGIDYQVVLKKYDVKKWGK